MTGILLRYDGTDEWCSTPAGLSLYESVRHFARLHTPGVEASITMPAVHGDTLFLCSNRRRGHRRVVVKIWCRINVN